MFRLNKRTLDLGRKAVASISSPSPPPQVCRGTHGRTFGPILTILASVPGVRIACSATKLPILTSSRAFVKENHDP